MLVLRIYAVISFRQLTALADSLRPAIIAKPRSYYKVRHVETYCCCVSTASALDVGFAAYAASSS
jgi:hypothetical protein